MNKNTKLASGLLRFLSVLVDVMIWLMLFLLVLLVISTSFDFSSLLDSLLYGLIIVIALTTFGAPIINSYIISKFGGSFGKLLTGTRIVKEDDGTYLNFKMAFLRNHIGYAVSSLMLGLGFLWLFIDEKKQAWHDMMVSSLVVVRSKQAYLMAILSVFFLIMLNVFIANKAYTNIMMNQELYVRIVEDIKSELEMINEDELLVPEDGLELEEVGLLH